MASSPTSPHDLIAELGFFTQEDSEVGQSVDAHYAKHGYYFKNKPGLELTKKHTLDNKQTRSILNSFFRHCSLGLIKSYGASSHDYCILNRISPSPEPQALMVLLWPSGSSMIFRSGSHKHLLKAGRSGIGLLEVPPENLEKPDIVTKKVEMETGGLSISDARISFRVLKGPIVFLGFVEPEELKYWAKMELPRLPELMKLVEEMQTEDIGANFEFKAPSDASSTSPSV